MATTTNLGSATPLGTFLADDARTLARKSPLRRRGTDITHSQPVTSGNIQAKANLESTERATDEELTHAHAVVIEEQNRILAEQSRAINAQARMAHKKDEEMAWTRRATFQS